MMKCCCTLVLCVVFSGIATAQTSPEGQFQFENDLTLNLHHFLFHLNRHRQPELKLRRVPLTPADRDMDFGKYEEAFSKALEAYKPFTKSDLLFNQELTDIRIAITSGKRIKNRSIAKALKLARPGYKKLLWPRHEKKNESLIQLITGELEQYEKVMVPAIAKDLNSRWPEQAIRVDVVYYSNWAGAYTYNEPNNIVMSSTDDYVDDGYALELLFHESAHTKPLGNSINTLTNAALERTGLKENSLWHSILFYATGETVKTVLDDPDYEPYAYHYGLWQRRNGRRFIDSLEIAWSTYDDFEQRINETVSLLAQEAEDN